MKLKSGRRILSIVLTILGLMTFSSKIEADPTTDSLALVSLYNATNGPQWTIKWNLTQPMKDWYGVITNANGTVGILNLSNNRLSGSLPNVNLPNLRLVDLSNNFIGGSIPNFTFSPYIESLNLEKNFFLGNIPLFSSFIRLRTLKLNNNTLSGAIPNFQNLLDLEMLDLRNNQLTGIIPNFDKLANLLNLEVSNNKLSGSLPPFNHLFLLRVLDIAHNEFSGFLPTFYNQDSLRILDISYNKLVGPIPNFVYLTSLNSLFLNNNQLSGQIPNFNNLNSLTENLLLQSNKLTGTVPNFSNLPYLKNINFSNNRIDSVPRFTMLLNLNYLNISKNKLTFNDIIPNLGLASNGYIYNLQDTIGTRRIFYVATGARFAYSPAIDPGYVSHLFKWYKNGQILFTSSNDSLIINNLNILDAGEYYCEVTSPLAPDLVLYTRSIRLIFNQISGNDECTNATRLSNLNNFVFNVDINNASSDVVQASCVTGSNNVWYYFTAQGDDLFLTIQRSTFLPEVNIALVQFEGLPCDGGNVVEIGCGINSLVLSNRLVAGATYFISLSVGDGSNFNFDLRINNPYSFLPPVNDTICGAIQVAPNGECKTFRNVDATPDIGQGLLTCNLSNTVWFKTRLSKGKNKLLINVENLNAFTNISFMVGYFIGSPCSGIFVPARNGLFCGTPTTTISCDSLLDDRDYYIQFSTSAFSAGPFQLCVKEDGPTLPCSKNANCQIGAPDGPGFLSIVMDNGTNCVKACNISAAMGMPLPEATCFSFRTATTYHYIKTDSISTGYLKLQLSSTLLNQPQLGLFLYDANCSAWTKVACNQGYMGHTQLENVPVYANAIYVIAVSDFNNKKGEYQLCASLVKNTNTCNMSSSIQVNSTSFGSPLGGPYLPEEEVDFCYQINYWKSEDCNFLQAIIPTFGPGWDSTSFRPDGEPLDMLNYIIPYGYGNWGWVIKNVVRYNVNNPAQSLSIQSPMPAGWYFTNNLTPFPNNVTPDSTQGDGLNCFGDQLIWQVCFKLKVKSLNACNGSADCFVKFKTYSDGEIGKKTPTSCLGDITSVHNASMHCCSDPVIYIPLDRTICSGTPLDITLTGSADPYQEFNYTAVADQQIQGSTSKNIRFLRDTLYNHQNTIATVKYAMSSTSYSCRGLIDTFRVTVIPNPTARMSGNASICKGDTAMIRLRLTGAPPYQFIFKENAANDTLIAFDTLLFIKKIPSVTALYKPLSVASHGCIGTIADSAKIVVNLPSIRDIHEQVCSGDSVLFFGTYYRFDGVYPHKVPGGNAVGCDSIIQLQLTTHPTYRNGIQRRLCFGNSLRVGQNVYTQTGQSTDTLLSQFQCDSIVDLDLIINDSIYVVSKVITPDIGPTRGSINIMMTGGLSPYQFRWSTGSFSSSIAGLPAGVYTVTVTDAIGCIAFSTFMVGTTSSSDPQAMRFACKVFPNPISASSEIRVRILTDERRSVRWMLYSSDGRRLSDGFWDIPGAPLATTMIIPSIAFPGLYFLKMLTVDGQTSIERIRIE